MPWTPCAGDGTIRGCVAGAWDLLVEAGDLPTSFGMLHRRDPVEYHRTKRDLEAAYQRLGRGDHDLPARVAAEFTTPSAPTQGVLL